MHVCLDYRPALHEGTGVGTYVRGLLRGLLEAHPDDRYTAFSASLSHRLHLPDELRAARAVDARFPVRLLDWLWHRQGWPPVESWVGPIDVAHSPTPMLLPSRCARVITVHDCHFLRHPEDVVGAVRRDYGPLLRRAVDEADAVMTVSESTRSELRELLEVPAGKVHVAPLGVEPEFVERSAATAEIAAERDADVRERFDLSGPYALFVGRREPRKDLGTLLRAFAHVSAAHPDLTLLLVGPSGPGWDELWTATPAGVRSRTRLLEHQHGRTLADLYAGAEALLLSSRWEGFGLTALEAMVMGTPVVATRVGALPEVAGDAASWAEPGDAEAFAAAWRATLEDSALRAQLVDRGRERASTFSWARTARATHRVYAEIGGSR